MADPLCRWYVRKKLAEKRLEERCVHYWVRLLAPLHVLIESICVVSEGLSALGRQARPMHKRVHVFVDIHHFLMLCPAHTGAVLDEPKVCGVHSLAPGGRGIFLGW